MERVFKHVRLPPSVAAGASFLLQMVSGLKEGCSFNPPYAEQTSKWFLEMVTRWTEPETKGDLDVPATGRLTIKRETACLWKTTAVQTSRHTDGVGAPDLLEKSCSFSCSPFGGRVAKTWNLSRKDRDVRPTSHTVQSILTPQFFWAPQKNPNVKISS